MKTTSRIILTTYKLHRYVILTGTFLLLVYAGFLNYTFLYKHNDVGNNLQFSSFLIQGGMLFFAILGCRLARKTMKQTSIVYILQKELWKVHSLNILFLVFLSLFFVSLSAMGYNLYYYLFFEDGSAFAHESIIFLINYWLFPFIIMGLIGYLFGMNSKNKVVFVLLLGIWVVFSPSNLYFIVNLIDHTKIESAAYLFRNLNLGVYDMSSVYDPFYGFEFEWGKKIVLIVFLTLILILSMRVNKRGLKRSLLLFTSIMILSTALVPAKNSFSTLNSFSKLKDDYLYYDLPPRINDHSMFSYKIKNMDIVLDNKGKDGIEVEVTMTLSNIKKQKILLTLYRGYKVSDIQLEGESISFVQNGDWIQLDLPETINKGSAKLTLYYSGIGSSSHPSLNNYMYLPSNFAWLPTNQPFPSMHTVSGEFLTSDLTPTTKIDYTLQYEGKEKLDYVSIDKIDRNKYRGNSKGLTLVSGNLSTTKINQISEDVTYPNAWFTHKSEIKEFLSTFNSKLEEYSQIVDEDFNMPEKVILLPNLGGNDIFTHTKAIKQEGYIILPINMNTTGIMEMQKMIPYQIPLTYQSNNSAVSDKTFKEWYIYSVIAGWYMSDSTKKEAFIQKNHLLIAIGPLSEHKHLWEKINTLEKEDISQELIAAWRDVLLDKDKQNWKQIETLLNSYQ